MAKNRNRQQQPDSETEKNIRDDKNIQGDHAQEAAGITNRSLNEEEANQDRLPPRGEATDPLTECRRLGDLIAGRAIDVAFIGIGENGHLAFNDPPADFQTEQPYLVVNLDEACRKAELASSGSARC